MLNHTAGLQNALASDLKSDPLLMCNWDETLKKLAAALPESSPGVQQVYHALTFGWLCGGIIEVCLSLSTCGLTGMKNRNNAHVIQRLMFKSNHYVCILSILDSLVSML